MSIIVVSFPRFADVFNTDVSTIVWLAIAFSVAELGLLLIHRRRLNCLIFLLCRRLCK